MGLDMYLYKEYYVKNWDHMTPEEKHTITITKGGKPSTIPIDKISEIKTEVMYWRKVNAIHKWFVDNVQEGKDDCGTYGVDPTDLQKLLNLVNDVLADHSEASALLPTTSGFFFGNTDYDEWYYDDLKRTKKGLEEALAVKDDGWFTYHSSW